jgi:Bacterial Ig-like domain
VNRKLLLVLSTLVLAMLVLGTSSALAIPTPCDPTDPDCEPFPEPSPGPTTTARPVHLFVTEPSDGTVSDTAAPTGQINCGAGGDDCGQIYTSLVTCDPEDDCTSDGPTETLVASGFPLPGYTARFFACTSNSAGTTACAAGEACDDGAGGCTLEMSQSWRVRLEWSDTTAPTTPSINGPAKVGPAVHHFTGGGATDNTGVSSYRYFLDGADEGLSAGGYDVDVASLSAGTHHVSARARDAAGNESDSSAALAFTVDRSAAVAITSPAAGGHFKTAPTFSFAHDGDVGEIVCQTLDAGSAVIHESACSSSYTPQPGADGDYSARIVFTDDVGNQATATRTFKLDTGDPNVVITSPGAGQHVKSPLTPAFTATDGGTVAGSLLKACKLESDAAFGGCGARSVADGPHTLSVRVTDEAGNARVATVDFDADSTGPRVAITSGPPDDAIITAPSATYGWTATDATAPLAQTCRLDGAAAAPCTSPKSLSGLSEGSHTFTVAVADALGNTTVVKRDVFVNAVRPSVAITSGPADGVVLRTTSATFGFTAAGGGAVSCSLDSETAYRPCSGASSDALAGLPDGAHTFRVRVRDVSDDVAIASRAFAVDTSTPGLKEIVKRIVNASVWFRYKAFPHFTTLRQLGLRRVPAGATISVRCKGRHCPARSLRKRGHGSVRLAKFIGRRLRVGTRLTIQVTKPGAIGKQFVITIRKARTPRLVISQIA